MSKVKPLPTERRPPEPVDRIYGPPEEGATPYKVRTGDDWYSLAIKFMVHETKLMDYNFKTTNPAYVNWYLREYVGCRLHDARGMNWKFSDDANPGIVWIPPRTIKGADIPHLGKPAWTGSWGESLVEVPHGPHTTERVFDAGHLAIATLEGAGIHAGLLLFGEVAAPFLAEAAVLMSIGGAYMDAFAVLAKAEARNGYAIGAVLGAKNTNAAFVKYHYMKEHYADKRLQNVYNGAVAAGFLDGRKLNEQQVRNLFTILHSRMHDSRIPKGDEWNDWSDSQKRDYNEAAARAFKNTFLMQ